MLEKHKEFLVNAKLYLQKQKSAKASDPSLLMVLKSIDTLCELLNRLITSDVELSDIRLRQLISHFEAIHHNVKVKTGESAYLRETKTGYRTLIESGYALLPHVRESVHDSPGAGVTITNREDDETKELECAKEQELYDTNPLFRQLLNSVWQYAIDNPASGYNSKKVFISYAWPIENKHNEAWTKPFVEKLALHLIEAGFQVYLDEIHSGAGFPLDKFMDKIQKVDHVLIISSKTMRDKLDNPMSGVSQENEKIKKYVELKALFKRRAVIPVLLNRTNYCDVTFLRLAEVPVCDKGYLNALRELIQRMYGEGNDFCQWFEAQLTSVHMLVFDQIPMSCSNYIERESLLTEMAARFKEHAHRAANPDLSVKLVCHGLRGSGATQLATQFCYRFYKAGTDKVSGSDKITWFDEIYWFEAKIPEKLKTDFITRAIRLTASNSNNDAVLIAELKKWFEKRPRCLLVFNDVSSYEMIEAFLPQLRVNILITSDNNNWDNAARVMVIEFTQEQLEAYMKETLGNREIDDTNYIKELIRVFGCNVAALREVCAYIKRNCLSIPRFFRLYQQPRKSEQMLQIFARWDHLLKMLHDKSILAYHLLIVCAQTESALDTTLLQQFETDDERNPKKEDFNEAKGLLLRYYCVIKIEASKVMLQPIIRETLGIATSRIKQLTFDVDKEIQKVDLPQVTKIGGQNKEAPQLETAVIFSGSQRWRVPASNPNFTGRLNLLGTLWQRLQYIRLGNLKPVTITAAQGMGGIGKTQLAIEYIYRNISNYRLICWIPAENPEQIQTTYLELAKDLAIATTNAEPKQIIKNVKEWLANNPGNLLVFDNATRFEDCESFIPQTGNAVLITSRTRGADWPGPLEVETFSEKDARQFIKKILGSEHQVTDEWIDQLATAMGYLPLALAQATAYVKHCDLTIEKYLQLYNENKAKHLAKSNMPTSDKHEPVYVTWDITMKKIAEMSKLAQKLLIACTCLHHDSIPGYLLEAFAKLEDNSFSGEIFEEALGLLNAYSMLTINENNYTISLHPLVQEILLSKQNQAEHIAILTDLCLILCRLFKCERADIDGMNKLTYLTLHAEILLSLIEKIPRDQKIKLNQCTLLFRTSRYHSFRGMVDKEAEALDKASLILQGLESEIGRTADSIYIHTEILHRKGTMLSRQYFTIYEKQFVENIGGRNLNDALLLRQSAHTLNPSPEVLKDMIHTKHCFVSNQLFYLHTIKENFLDSA